MVTAMLGNGDVGGSQLRTLVLDTNVVLRFLVGDHPGHLITSTKLMHSAARGELKLFLTNFVAAEAIHTLTSYYKFDRTQVAGALANFVQTPGIVMEDTEVFLDALERFTSVRVDFVDAFVAAVAANARLGVSSYDKDFDRFTDVERVEPK